MLGIVAILTTLTVCMVTYVGYQAFGPQRASLFFTREEKKDWDRSLSRGLGDWLTVSNIVGTLTSLATVYVFFIGNYVLFGPWILVCIATLYVGRHVTERATHRILADPDRRHRLEAVDLGSGVIASVLWSDDPEGRWMSRLGKAISLAGLLAVIWLEFSVFADILSYVVGLRMPLERTAVIFALTFVVVHFTMRFGLRGFVFADLFQSPLILVGSLLVLVGAALVALDNPSVEVLRGFQHRLPLAECVLFAVATVFLNSFLVLATEPHWMRVWMFGEREQTMQRYGVGSTAAVWMVLLAIGFAVSLATDPGILGTDSVNALIQRLGSVSIVLAAGFFIAGTATLFSTADAHIFATILVSAYDTRRGRISTEKLTVRRPWFFSLAAASLAAAIYFAVKEHDLPFEKVVLLVFPIYLNLVPGLTALWLGLKPRPAHMVMSLILYAACCVLAFGEPHDDFLWTLATPLAPVVPTLLAAAPALLRRRGYAS